MNAAEHAERILESWERGDSCLQDELLYALGTCMTEKEASALEQERREVLRCAVEQLRSLRGFKARGRANGEIFFGPLALLRHLRQLPRTKAASAY